MFDYNYKLNAHRKSLYEDAMEFSCIGLHAIFVKLVLNGNK